MKSLRKAYVILIFLPTLLLTTATAQQDTIRIGWVKYNDDNDTTSLNLLENYLEVETGYKVEIYPTKPYDYKTVIKAFKSTNPYDFAFFTPYTYVLTKKEYKEISPLVTYIRKTDNVPHYHSWFVWIDSKSFEEKIEELKQRKGYIAFTNYRSTSGYLWPRGYLISELDIDISRIDSRIKGGHIAALESLLDQDDPAMMAASWDIDIANFRKANNNLHLEKERINTKIPNDPIVYRHGVPDSLRTLVFSVLEKMHKTSRGSSILTKLDILQWVEQDDDAYETIRAFSKFSYSNPVISLKGITNLPKSQINDLVTSNWFEIDTTERNDLEYSATIESNKFTLKRGNDILLAKDLTAETTLLVGDLIENNVPQIAYINEEEVPSNNNQYRIELGEDRGIESGMAALISYNNNPNKIPARIVEVAHSHSIISIFQRDSLRIQLIDDKYFKVEVFPSSHIQNGTVIEADVSNPILTSKTGLGVEFNLKIEVTENHKPLGHPEGVLIEVKNKDNVAYWLLSSSQSTVTLKLPYKSNMVSIGLSGSTLTKKLTVSLKVFYLLLEWVIIGGVIGGLIRFIGFIRSEILPQSTVPWKRILKYLAFYIVVGPITGGAGYLLIIFLVYTGGSVITDGVELVIFDGLLTKLVLGITGGLLGVEGLVRLAKRIQGRNLVGNDSSSGNG